MRITGFVTIGGSREWIDWTITDSEIIEGPGLSASEITLEGSVAPLEIQVETTPDDGYEELTVTELKVLLQQAGEPIYGNKEQLINRLRAWDAANPGLQVTLPDDEDTEEASATDDAPPVEEGTEGDEVDGPESE
jgi:hypothetical protein